MTLGKTVHIFKGHFHCYCPNAFSKLIRIAQKVLVPMINVSCIFAEFQTGATADHCFKAIT